MSSAKRFNRSQRMKVIANELKTLIAEASGHCEENALRGDICIKDCPFNENPDCCLLEYYVIDAAHTRGKQ
jgi:hypothetical protein